MDEATRPGGPAIDDRKRGPQEIREDIERTREELGETVEALAAKTDVKAQARAKVEETKERTRRTMETVKERVGAARPGDDAHGAVVVHGTTHRPATANGMQVRARGAARVLRRHPEIFAFVAAFAAGALAGSLAAG